MRIELKLEEQERLLLQARMAALQNQINPHFLFNTLNSISSLVRFDPDTAREMILKLATILRRLLNSTDSFVSLHDEVAFIDNYLDIEVVRFGRDKLQGDQGTRSGVARSHGAEHDSAAAGRKFNQARAGSEGGRRQHYAAQPVDQVAAGDRGGRRRRGHGCDADWSTHDGTGGAGIGMANVAERLKVLYGDAAKMMIERREGGGTLIRLRLPILPNPEELMTTAALSPAPSGKSLRKAE